jgi:hypothetical protein
LIKKPIFSCSVVVLVIEDIVTDNWHKYIIYDIKYKVMKLVEHVLLSLHTTFRMGGEAAYFTEVFTEDELAEALLKAESIDMPVWILGGGSNILIPDAPKIEAFVIKISIAGFTVLVDTEDGADIRIGAGELWDTVVERTVSMELSGLEALSAIPGTVGGTPVQNVGAYGQEVKNVIARVRVYDRLTKEFRELSNEERDATPVRAGERIVVAMDAFHHPVHFHLARGARGDPTLPCVFANRPDGGLPVVAEGLTDLPRVDVEEPPRPRLERDARAPLPGVAFPRLRARQAVGGTRCQDVEERGVGVGFVRVHGVLRGAG